MDMCVNRFITVIDSNKDREIDVSEYNLFQYTLPVSKKL